jgi:hypothetical protein
METKFCVNLAEGLAQGRPVKTYTLFGQQRN